MRMNDRNIGYAALAPERLAQIQRHADHWFGRLAERGETDLRGGSPWPGYVRDLLPELRRLRTAEAEEVQFRGEVEAVLCNVAQLISGWQTEPCWSEWDRSVYESVIRVLKAVHGAAIAAAKAREEAPNA